MSNISKAREPNVCKPDRSKYGGVCGRYARKVQTPEEPYPGLNRMFLDPAKVQHEVEPSEMFLRGFLGEVLGVYS